MDPQGPDRTPHLPGPSLWPIGFAIGIDATAKGPLEGTREWPPEIDMSPEIRELVDRRWSEYGIDLDAATTNGARRRGLASRLLRR